MSRLELDEFADVSLLEGELEWVMKVIDSPKEPISGVMGQGSLQDASCKG